MGRETRTKMGRTTKTSNGRRDRRKRWRKKKQRDRASVFRALTGVQDPAPRLWTVPPGVTLPMRVTTFRRES